MTEGTCRDPEVLVIGGGNAGLCAALAARRAGADVLLVERAQREWRGGNSKYTRNIRCAHGDDETMPGRYSEAEFAADLASVTGAGSDAALTALVISHSKNAPRWMELNGIRWQAALRGTLQLARTNRFFLGGGKALVNTYFATAEQLGVDVAYGRRVEAIRLDGGECTAVEIETGRGRYTLRPKAIVVASGGFEANREWLAEYWGKGAHNYAVRGARQNDGNVLRLLLEAGALARGNPRGFHAVAVDARGPMYEGGIATRVDSVPFSVMVNRQGQRFYDEGEDLWPKRYATWGRLIAEQPGQIAFSVFDAKALGRFMTTVYPPCMDETVIGLADQLGLPARALEETVDEYNAAVRDGSYDPTQLDDCATANLVPSKSHWALRIDTPPYYAYPLRPGITFTYLGVAVDTKAHILREDSSPFANLFAAGEIMAGNVLMRGYLAGFGMTIGTVFGQIAGEEAARYVRTR